MATTILLLLLPVVICNSQSPWRISSSPKALVPFANPFSLTPPNFSTYLWTNLKCDGLRGLLVRHSAEVEFEAFEGNPFVPVKPRGVCGASWVDVVSPVLLNVTLSALPKHSDWTYVGEFVWRVEQTSVGFYAVSFGSATSTLLMPDCTASSREIAGNSKIPVTLEIVVEPSLQTEGKKRALHCKTPNNSNPSLCIDCDIGYYLQSGHCIACTVCSKGYYQSSSCQTGSDMDTGCTACSTCGSGKYISSCTSSGAVCTACSTSCGSGYYLSAACTSTANTVCTACDPSCSSCFGGTSHSCNSCSSGYYASDINTCTACSTCGSGYYISAACTTLADTVCAACSTCGSGYYISAACTSTANTVCTACQTITNCAAYSSTCSTGTDTTDRVCTACGM